MSAVTEMLHGTDGPPPATDRPPAQGRKLCRVLLKDDDVNVNWIVGLVILNTSVTAAGQAADGSAYVSGRPYMP